MKKSAAIVAYLAMQASLGASEIHPPSLSTNVKFSTEQSSRGRKKGGKFVSSKAELQIPVREKLSCYCGVIADLGMDSQKASNEISPYAGISWPVTDKFTLDMGCSHNFSTNFEEENKRDHIKRDSTEIYCGVAADVFLSPLLYAFYDFGSEDLDIEGGISHTFELPNNFTFEPKAKFGYRRANKPGACEKYDESMGKKDYFYGGLSADLVYRLNDHSKLRMGPEFVCNSAKKDAWTNCNGGRKSLLWFNAAADFSF